MAQAAFTINSAADSTATASIGGGSCPISRRCSTTTPPGRCYLEAYERPATPLSIAWSGRRLTCLARHDLCRRELYSPRRRQRRRRRKFLLLDARRDRRRAGTRAGQDVLRGLRRDGGGNFEGRNNPPPRPGPWKPVAKELDRDFAALESELAADRGRLLRSAAADPSGRDDKSSSRGTADDRRVGPPRRSSTNRAAATRRQAAISSSPRFAWVALGLARVPESTGKMSVPPGGLRRSWRNGRPGGPPSSTTTPAWPDALTTLHQQQPQKRWLERAVALADVILAPVRDRRGGFFYTPDNHEPLIVRRRTSSTTRRPAQRAGRRRSLAAGRFIAARRLSSGRARRPPRVPRRVAAVPHGRRPSCRWPFWTIARLYPLFRRWTQKVESLKGSYVFPLFCGTSSVSSLVESPRRW